MSIFMPPLPMPLPLSVTHRFIPGLRFEDTLAYQTCTPAGQTGWDNLPLEPQTPEDYAGQGVWWCVRRCAAVLLRKPWQSVQLRPHLPPRPPPVLDPGCVAEVMQSLLPYWPVACLAGTVHNPVTACAPALLEGGSALLLMQPREPSLPVPLLFWTWVVGLETQRRRVAGPQEAQALLTMPFGGPVPWSCGYTARVQMNKEGLCDVGSVSGQWHMGRCLAAITLSPQATRGRSADAAALH